MVVNTASHAHQVGVAQQDHAGNIMAFLLLFGLTIGAIIGEIFPFVLEPENHGE